MQLQKIYITRDEYGPNKGRLSGKVEFTGQNGAVVLPLDDDLSKQVIAVCADSLVRASKDLANNLTAEIISATPALPAF